MNDQSYFLVGLIIAGLALLFFLRSRKKETKPDLIKANPAIKGGEETECRGYQKIKNALHKLRDDPTLFNEVNRNNIVVKERLNVNGKGVAGAADYTTRTIYIRLGEAKSLSLKNMVGLLLHEAFHIKAGHLMSTPENEAAANKYTDQGSRNLGLI